MNDEDRDWFENLLKSKIENFGVKIDEVIDQRPVIYADFMIQAVDSRTYDYVADHKKVDIYSKIQKHFCRKKLASGYPYILNSNF